MRQFDITLVRHCTYRVRMDGPIDADVIDEAKDLIDECEPSAYIFDQSNLDVVCIEEVKEDNDE